MKLNIFSQIIRFPLKFIPSNLIMTIIFGSLKGHKWIKGSGNNGYWIGIYESKKQNLFSKKIKSEDIIYDIGANVGFYTLLASKSKRVYAFEPLLENLHYLKKHLELNNVNNVEVFDIAITNYSGKTFFKNGENSSTGAIGNIGREINCKKLDDLDIIPPTIIKIDIEGEEFNALNGAMNTLSKYKPVIFLSTHTAQLKLDCLNFLKNIGYKYFEEIYDGEFYIKYE